MGIPDSKFMDNLCEMNLLYLGCDTTCTVCQMIITPEEVKDNQREFLYNKTTGTVIHYRCYVENIVYIVGKRKWDYDL